MKKFYYLPLALAALAFSACSSDDTVTPEGGKTLADLEGGYMNVSINLPTQSATKADVIDNGTDSGEDAGKNGAATLNDGKASEYEVKDAILVLFTKANDTDADDAALFHSAYNIGASFGFKNEANTQITSTVQIIQKLDKEGNNKGGDFYALVILNTNDNFTVANGGLTITNGGTTTSLTANTTTFKDFSQTVMKVTSDNKVGDAVTTFNTTGFLMTNALLSTTPGGSTQPTAAPTTLVKIDGEKVYPTAREAAQDPAADIYVERAMAKVTLATPSTSYTLSDGKDEGKAHDAQGTVIPVTATVTGWNLDITNKTSFLVHRASDEVTPTANTISWDLASQGITSGANQYRMVGSTDATEGSSINNTKLYRTYWGIDPNYNTATATSDFELLDGTDFSTSAATLQTTYGDENPQYCFENTFDVANQLQDRTTRVVVQVQLQPSKVITEVSSTGVETWGDYTAESGFYYIQNSNKYYSEAGLESAIKFQLATGESEVSVSGEDNGTATVTIGTDTKTTEAQAAVGTIKYYKGGICYYPIRIKHFGDDMTPWNTWEAKAGATAPQAGDASAVYPNLSAANYLGRYGVLRNNWYDISVSSIALPGSPVIPERTDTPDDELNNYISYRINILSWAKRTQSADL